ncbi:MAG: hypothetical protein PVSMB8_12560 [Vulcanimicrobiaceae bacterium]
MIERAPEFGYDDLVRDIAGCLTVLLPSSSLQWMGDVLVCRRGVATAHVSPTSAVTARAVFARREVVEIDATVTISRAGADDVIGDLVGYLLGAPLGSLSVYPHHVPIPQAPTRRRPGRRPSAWDRTRITAPRERSAPLPFRRRATGG